MTSIDPTARARSSSWTARDLVLAALAVGLLIAVTGALATRDQWTALVGAQAAVPVSIAALTTSDFHSLAFDPRDPDLVYFGHHEGVMKSTDAGRTWRPIMTQGDAMSLVATDNSLVMAGHEVFMRSSSAGAVWSPIRTNLPGQDIHGFAISPTNRQTYYAFIIDYGLWRSDDGGANWVLVSKELPDSVLALAVIPTTPETLYAGTIDQGLLKSMDGGKTWKAVNALSMKMAVGLAQDPRDPRIVYAGTEGGLYRSNSDATAWTRVGLTGKDIATVGISPANPARILVVDAQGRVYRSDDRGNTWGAR